MQAQDTLTYVFMGHTYEWGGGGAKVDERIENMDLTQFDRIWLGGDICSETSLNYSTIEYIDSLFDIGKPGNHWALGNHDTRDGNPEWINEFTKRPDFYAYHENGITTVVLDGGISPLDCENINKQYEMIKNVCDTVSNGYLIFLVHQAINQNVPGIEAASYAHVKIKNWEANCYSDSASYADLIYPMLVEVEAKGVEVIHIVGDIGMWAKSYYGISSDGIEYLASGINNSQNFQSGTPVTNTDKLLVFKHVLSTNTLTWEFVELNSF